MKKKNVKKLNMMKCKDLRIYKDNARPTVFDDKRRKVKHKNKILEELLLTI